MLSLATDMAKTNVQDRKKPGKPQAPHAFIDSALRTLDAGGRPLREVRVSGPLTVRLDG